jgi:hypothetical protein
MGVREVYWRSRTYLAGVEPAPELALAANRPEDRTFGACSGMTGSLRPVISFKVSGWK